MTYKRVDYVVVVPEDTTQTRDYGWEGLQTLMSQGQWGKPFVDPVTGETITTTVVASHAQDANGTTALSLAYQGAADELPQGQVGFAYSISFKGTGTTGPFTYAQFGAGSLPPGLTLSAAGALTGTPNTAGSYTFTIRVTDARGYRHNHTYAALVILPA